MKLLVRFLGGLLAAQTFLGAVAAYGQSRPNTPQDPPRAVLVDPKGATYVGSASFATVTKFESDFGPLWSIPLSGHSGSEVLALALSPDGSIFAAGTDAKNTGFLAQLRASGQRVRLQSLPQAVQSLAIDPAGSVYLAGDGYLCKRNPDLTPVFEQKMDGSVRVAVDHAGGVYAAISGRNGHGEVRKLAPTGDGWMWQLDLGPARLEAIAVDPLGSIYVTGGTASGEFVVKNAVQSRLAGSSDAIVAKLSASGELVWSTYLGGSGAEAGASIAFDSRNHPVIGGYTSSSDFPAVDRSSPTNGAVQGILAWMDGEGAVTRSVPYGTRGQNRIHALAADAKGRIIVAGVGIGAVGEPVAFFTRLDDPAQPPTDFARPSVEVEAKASGAHREALANGGFEFGAAGSAPPGWVVTPYLNTNGFTLQSPQTLDTLNLSPGGAGLTTTVQGANLPDPDLGSAASFRYSRYGNQAARLNYHSSSNFMHAQNANNMWQTTTISAQDIDPADGLAHIRFTYAPILQNPSHPLGQQPFYFFQVTNLTRNTILYSYIGYPGKADILWRTINPGTANEYDYADWQLFDLAPGSQALALGDQVKVEIVASGCQPGGHEGELYVDGGAGAAIPGIFVTGTAPAVTSPGSNLTYNLRYTNGNSYTETGVVIDFGTPPNTTFQSISAPANLNCTTPAVGATGQITCTFASSLEAGASGTLAITVNVSQTATDAIIANNYDIHSNQETPLYGPFLSSTLTCSTDSNCSAAGWCSISRAKCVPKLANGIPMPQDAGHTNPVLNGICTAAAAVTACQASKCSASTNTCGPALSSIVVNPGSASISPAATQQFSAVATFVDNTIQDLTASAAWQSSNTAVAQITSPGGLAKALADGFSQIAATVGGLSSMPVTLTVSGPAKIDPIITWAKPAQILAGTVLGPAQLNATANVPGTFSYTPPQGTALPDGNGQLLYALFTPTDTVHYNAVTASVQIDVAALKVNPGFESGKPGDPPPGWIVTTYLNTNGFTLQSPQTLDTLNLTPGGVGLTTTVQGANLPDPDLGSAASFRYSRYGNQSALVNHHSSSGYGHGQNANDLWQTTTISVQDIDPIDGLAHIRFVYVPILQNSGHAFGLQPFYFFQVTNLTKNTILYSYLGYPGKSDILWKSIGAGTAAEIDYADWQLFDFAPGPQAIALGDQVKVEIVAAGCQPNGHEGEIYVDGGAGAAIPGIFVTGTAPAVTSPGSNITYNLRYTNGNPYTETGVVIDFTTPPNTVFQSVSVPANISCTTPAVGTSGQLTCTLLSSLNSGATGTLAITVKVSQAASGAIVANNYDIHSNQETPLYGPFLTTTLGPPTLLTIAVSPVNLAIAPGATQQYVATGIFSDNSTQNLTSSAAWNSSNPAAATITSPGGLAKAVATGSSVITASLNGVTSAPVLLVVDSGGKATPAISWAAPAPIIFGSALSSGQLNATANVPGTFTYTPPAGTVLPAGNGQTLFTTFVPTDTTHYTTTSASVLIDVTPSNVTTANLIVTQVLSRDPITNDVILVLTLTNNGGQAAQGVQLADVHSGTTLTTTALPMALGVIAGGGQTAVTVRLPATLASGTKGVLTVAGNFTGGSFSANARVVWP